MSRPLAVITGASSGIGEIFARKLAPTHDLLLIARRLDRLQALAAELSAQHSMRAEVMQADLTDDADLTRIAARLADDPSLELLVNNAGFGTRGFFWKAPLDEQESMHRLHVLATVRLTHAALRNLTARNTGAVINVSSVASFVRSAGATSYCATKSWMTTFTEGLHLELASIGSGTKVQALCPGFTYSEFHDVAKLDRRKSASPSFWLDPNFVVDQSLVALTTGKWIVIPGWRYKLLTALFSKLPIRLRVAIESRITRKKSSKR
jgi:short-subunit dehydrogenase